MQPNASTRHTRFASLRYQTCIKNASKCSKKYSNNAAQCEQPTHPLSLPTLSNMHQKCINMQQKNTGIMQHTASTRHTRFASLRYQACIKNASTCSKKYSNNAVQCEHPTYPLCLPTLSNMHQKCIKTQQKKQQYCSTMRAPDIPALPPYAIKHASKMHQNAAKKTAILQHNASTRHTRFASLRYQTCIKNASKCSKKYSNNAAQCEPPTYPLCLPTLSKMHQNAARHPAQNTAGAQHNANPRQPRFASLRYQKYIKN